MYFLTILYKDNISSINLSDIASNNSKGNTKNNFNAPNTYVQFQLYIYNIYKYTIYIDNCKTKQIEILCAVCKVAKSSHSKFHYSTQNNTII